MGVVSHVRGMLAKFEGQAAICHARSAKQWRKLKEVMILCCSFSDVEHESSGGQSPRTRTKLDSPFLAQRRSKADSMKKVERAHARERIYEPNNRVKMLPGVHRREAELKEARCSHCSGNICSAWYFTHPVRGSVSLLIPDSGCRACRRATHNRGNLIVPDGTATKKDQYSF